MDVLAPTFAWISSLLNQVGTTVGSAANIAVQVAPSPVPIPAPSTATLGLKLLLDPAAGGIIFRAASNTVATIYPVYASAKAIESKETADDVQWLTYWTLYGSLILAEHVADQALGKVPYYYHAKFAFLLWLQLPQTQGATYLYKRYYKPVLAKYSPRIDACLDKGKSVLETLYSMYKGPIDASVSLLKEVKKQASTTLKWLFSDESSALRTKKQLPDTESIRVDAA